MRDLHLKDWRDKLANKTTIFFAEETSKSAKPDFLVSLNDFLQPEIKTSFQLTSVVDTTNCRRHSPKFV